MYNRYILQDSDYIPIERKQVDNQNKPGGTESSSSRRGSMTGKKNPSLTGEKVVLQRLFSGVGMGKNTDWRKLLRLDSLDSGDLLVLLILFLLVSDGDDWEPILALGLFFLLGFREEKDRGAV